LLQVYIFKSPAESNKRDDEIYDDVNDEVGNYNNNNNNVDLCRETCRITPFIMNLVRGI